MPITKEQFYTVLQKCLGYSDDGFRVGRQFPVALGEGLSIQASAGHYCQPKETLKDVSGYTHVEVYTGQNPYFTGYLREYNDGSDTVAAYVPVDVLVEALNDYEQFMKG